MTNEKHGREAESLGQFLTRTRISQGFELAQIVEETRISGSNLKAMEADDYSALPADAFTRGFYALYARRLNLDPEEIVARFKTERGVNPRKGSVPGHNPPAHKASRQVSDMAEPSTISLLSTIGYVLLLFIILSGGVFWYFNINPATFISEKLRSLQHEETPAARPADINDGTQQPTSSDNKSQGATSTLDSFRSFYICRDAGTFGGSEMTPPPLHA